MQHQDMTRQSISETEIPDYHRPPVEGFTVNLNGNALGIENGNVTDSGIGGIAAPGSNSPAVKQKRRLR